MSEITEGIWWWLVMLRTAGRRVQRTGIENIFVPGTFNTVQLTARSSSPNTERPIFFWEIRGVYLFRKCLFGRVRMLRSIATAVPWISGQHWAKYKKARWLHFLYSKWWDQIKKWMKRTSWSVWETIKNWLRRNATTGCEIRSTEKNSCERKRKRKLLNR